MISECRNAECHNAECRYAEFLIFKKKTFLFCEITGKS
jgi:hypothetical protein